jgi:hypothetical protein
MTKIESLCIRAYIVIIVKAEYEKVCKYKLLAHSKLFSHHFPQGTKEKTSVITS